MQTNMQRYIHLFCFMLSSIALLGQEVVLPENREQFHIFLLLGGSNMAGNAVLTGMDTQSDPRILKLNRNNNWVLAQDSISPLYSQAVGPGMAFAKRLLEDKPDITIGLVTTAMADTSISQWERGSALYYSTIWRANMISGKGVIKGILWHQGESDSVSGANAAVYRQKLQLLIDNLRMDLGQPDLPFIVGGFVPQIVNSGKHPQASAVWSNLKWVGENVHQAAYVPSYGTEQLGDNLHFSAAGQRLMGNRYANAVLAMDGTWLSMLHQRMNEQSQAVGAGWKSHPIYGLYYDANFPVIKHNWLNWVKVGVNASEIIKLTSTDFGSINISPESRVGGFYLHREVADPEARHLQRGDSYFVNVGANQGDPRRFYNHTTGQWIPTIDNAPGYDSILSHYLRAESQFVKTQQSLVKTQNSARNGSWGETRMYLTETEWNRYLTILYAQEAWNFVSTSGVAKAIGDIWRDRVMDLISRIDSVLLAAQQSYVTLVSSGVPQLPPPPSGDGNPSPTPTPVPNPTPTPEPNPIPTDPEQGNSWGNPIVVGTKSAKDAFSWNQSIVLAEVRTGEPSINPGRQRVSFPCTKPTEWVELDIDPSSSKVNLAVGNFWVIQKVGEKFYAVSTDYFRKDRFYNEWAPHVFWEKLPPESPDSANLTPMSYKKGETYGFMVTTLALNSYRTTNERSNVMFFTMP
jgi:hypothetical protein